MPAQSRQVVHADIKPENTPELASRYLDVPEHAVGEDQVPGHPDQGALFRRRRHHHRPVQARAGRRRAAARAHRARADLRARRHDRGPRGRVRAGPVRVAAGRQSARGRDRPTAPSFSASSSSPTASPTARSSSPKSRKSSGWGQARKADSISSMYSSSLAITSMDA